MRGLGRAHNAEPDQYNQHDGENQCPDAVNDCFDYLFYAGAFGVFRLITEMPGG